MKSKQKEFPGTTLGILFCSLYYLAIHYTSKTMDWLDYFIILPVCTLCIFVILRWCMQDLVRKRK